MASQQQEPSVITLTSQNSAQILTQYVELAQGKGAFTLAEAELLKRAADVAVRSAVDAELNASNSRQLLVQGVHKGQRHGAYTLNDAALLSKVVQFVSAQLQSGQGFDTPEPVPEAPAAAVPAAVSNEDDLSDLAEPIPLKAKEV